jgi:hypothetical protein
MSIADEARAQAALEAEARRLGVQPFELRMARAVPDDVMRDIVADQRRGVAQPSGLAAESDAPRRSMPRGVAVGAEIPLAPPPGVALCDRIADHFAALDRVERARRLGGGG